jgi:hypothetical protein
MNLFHHSRAGKFRPSWWGESKKLDRGSVTIGIDLYIRKKFSNVREAAAHKELFNRLAVNIIS